MRAYVAIGALVHVLLGLSVRASMHCAQRREISPCTCRKQSGPVSLLIACERMVNYQQVSTALKGRFPDTTVTLEVTHSDVRDLAGSSLADLALNVHNCKLNYNNISELNGSAFQGMTNIAYFSLADNKLGSVPKDVLRHMPNIRTLDLGRNNIKIVNDADFKDIANMHHLVLPGNGLTVLEKNSLPCTLQHLHLGINQLTTLNGTLRTMESLEWLFINSNKLTSIDNEMPMLSQGMTMIHAANNQLKRLPKDLQSLPKLDAIYFYSNNIQALNGALQKSKLLHRVNLSLNNIKYLAHDDFAETTSLALLDLGYNQLQSLNGSLTKCTLLRYLNLTHNELTEFSLQEIKGLERLWVVDLSHNKITHLSGHTENLVDLGTHLLELRLEHNRLQSLGGALMGLHGLLRLNMSHNLMEIISPDDLIGLDELKVLDVSHNKIKTLEETSKTYLPALEELLASNNNLTLLDKDFHGLPILCWADLSYNQIASINFDLVTKTKCLVHGVKGTLKVYLNDNPVLCDEHFPDLVLIMDKLHARFLGECSKKKPIGVSPPVLIVPTLMNDIVAPIDGQLGTIGNPIVSVVPLESQVISQSKLFQAVGGLMDHIITERNIDLPIIVDPPITLPPVTTSTILPQIIQGVPNKSLFNLEPEPAPETPVAHQSIQVSTEVDKHFHWKLEST